MLRTLHSRKFSDQPPSIEDRVFKPVTLLSIRRNTQYCHSVTSFKVSLLYIAVNLKRLCYGPSLAQVARSFDNFPRAFPPHDNMKDAKRNAAASAAGQPKPATTRVSSPEKPVTKSMSQTTASSSSSKPAPTKEPAAGSKATGHTVAAKGHADAHDAGGAAAGGKQVPAVGHKIPATYRNHATRRPATDSSLPKGSSSIAVSDGQRPNRRPREAHAGPQATGAPSIPSSNTQAKSSQRVAKGDELPHRPAPHATPGPSREASSNPNVAAEIPGLKYEASDRVGNLRVFKDPPGKILTEEDEEPEREDMPQARDEDQVFIILSHCVHFGLRILENAKGRQALVAGGGKYVSAIQAKRIAYDKPAEDMPYWVAAFLHLIREDFYDLYATRTLDCANSAETERINWGTDLEEYKPKLAAAIYFNGTVSSTWAAGPDMDNQTFDTTVTDS